MLTYRQSPWLPELAALFDDIKKISPGNAYDVIG
jgi:THO complex subunit 2